MNDSAKKAAKIPHRSKSSTLVVLRLLGCPQKEVRRSRSMPLRTIRPCVSDSEEQVGKTLSPCQHETSAAAAPPLNRWSSAPACALHSSNACSMAPSRAQSMRNLHILPPRQPTRRSGKAEELRSALPPKYPLRKPGDAAMASHALPPFLPKRFIEHDSAPYCSGSNNTDMNCLSSFAFCNINNASFVSLLSDSDDSDFDQDEDDQEVTSTFPPKAVTIRANIRRVLGEVLEQLDDDDDHFSVPGYI